MKDSSGVVIVFNPDVPSHLKEIETWYSMFISSQGLLDNQCLLIAHHKPGSGVEDERLPLGNCAAGFPDRSCLSYYSFSTNILSFWCSLTSEQTVTYSLQPGGGARGREANLLQILGKCCECNVRESRARGDVHHYIVHVYSALYKNVI